ARGMGGMGGSTDRQQGGDNAGGGTAGFTLAVGEEQVILVQGGSVEVPIFITRTPEADQGSIVVTASELPEGVTFREAVVAPGSNKGVLTLEATESAKQLTAIIIVRAASSSSAAETS